jgi:hypothetical protein
MHDFSLWLSGNYKKIWPMRVHTVQYIIMVIWTLKLLQHAIAIRSLKSQVVYSFSFFFVLHGKHRDYWPSKKTLKFSWDPLFERSHVGRKFSKFLTLWRTTAVCMRKPQTSQQLYQWYIHGTAMVYDQGGRVAWFMVGVGERGRFKCLSIQRSSGTLINTSLRCTIISHDDPPPPASWRGIHVGG